MTHGQRRRLALPAPSRDWAFFFDLDGTLVEIESVPTRVHADAELRALIASLALATNGAVAVITGRPITDIDALFPDLRLPVAGQHGVERRTASGVVLHQAGAAGALDVARHMLGDVVRRHAGLMLEDKGLSLALHYRQTPRLASYAHRVMHAARNAVGDEYCLQRGKRVVELKPAGRNKGIALSEFMQEHPFSGRMPLFIGDDVTDEYAFLVVNSLGGLSVKVGGGRTAARHQLASVTAVRRWLSQCLGPSQDATNTIPDRSSRERAAFDHLAHDHSA